jgi:DNA-binding NarL/FixJ family response regulator
MNNIHARALELVGDVSGLLEPLEFRDGLLVALLRAVPAEYISMNRVGYESDLNWSIVQPPLTPDHHATFYRLALENPLAERFLRTRYGSPLRVSDVSTPEAFHATDLYREFYAPLHVEYQIAFVLPSDDQHILAIALSRGQRDFTDQERDLLAIARPHLIQAYRNALQHRSAPGPETKARAPITAPDELQLQALGLTPAQARVLRLIAMGRSTGDIAGDLQIAQRTVHKHLQRTYQTLGVKDRSAAADRAWQTTGSVQTSFDI